jgi:hypothetical protein
MYHITDGPEAVRLNPSYLLRPVFKSKLAKVWKTLQTPEAFRTWLEGRAELAACSWGSGNDCGPLKEFVRTLVARRMEVRGNQDRTVSISDWKHPGSKPTAELNLPSWVWKFMDGYFEAWADYWKVPGDTEYVAGSCMDAEAVLRILMTATGGWRG